MSEGGGEDLLRRFDDGLADEEVEIELCVVGGAVLSLAFVARPSTRRPRSLFASPQVALSARRRAAEKSGVGLDRLEGAARAFVGASAPGTGPAYEGRSLTVFAPPPDYLLAMKCASLHFVGEPSASDDVRYLLRYMGIRQPDEALQVVEAYLNPRQRPEDLESVFAAMLG